MKLRDLTEAPIGDYATIGNWGDNEKSNSFNHANDRRLIQSDNLIKKVRKKFGNTDHVLNFYFINLPGMRKFAETGIMTPKLLKERLPDVWNLVQEREREQGTDAHESINVLYVGNAGVNRVPMTAWIMAHRLGHAVRQTVAWKDFVTDFLLHMRTIFDNVYGITTTVTPNESFRNINDLELSRFYESIGTMASARNKKLGGRPYEFYYELFAQYITTGKISMRELPKSWGSKNRMYHSVDEDARQYYSNDLIEPGYGVVDQWGERVDSVLYNVTGKYLVM